MINKLLKLFGLAQKQKREPVKPTTNQAKADDRSSLSDGARLSPAAAMSENASAIDRPKTTNLARRSTAIAPPGGDDQPARRSPGENGGEGGLSLHHSSPSINNTVKNPTHSKAKSCKNTVENISPSSV